MIGVLVVKDGVVVQSVNFKRYLPVGKPAVAVEYLNRWGIDEIVLLDVDATVHARTPYSSLIEESAEFCHVPLAFGGGISTVSDIEMIIRAGADKVAINSSFFKNPKLVSEGANVFGSQCILVSIDVRKNTQGDFEAYTHSGTKATGLSAAAAAVLAQDSGAGEILVNSIDRDGAKNGYDLELIRDVTKAVSIPVIACGGVGKPSHFHEAAPLEVSALAAANFFHFTEHSVITAKQFLKNTVNIRLDTYAQYNDMEFDRLERVAKMSDDSLEKLRFEYIPEEVI